MVAEQIGPQGKHGWLEQTTKGVEAERTKHKVQQVIHGPVIYKDQVYDALAEESDGVGRLTAAIFTNSTKYAGQREYRFAVLNDGADDETVLLRISGDDEGRVDKDSRRSVTDPALAGENDGGH